jgi:HK97 family phage major capsid protein
MTPIESLRQRRAQVANEMASTTAAVQAEDRAMSDEENTKFQALRDEYKTLGQSIANFEYVEGIEAELAQPQPRVAGVVELPQTAAAQSSTPFPVPYGAAVSGGTQVPNVQPHHGFKMGFGEYLLKVREAKTSGRVDPRLRVNTISTFGGESVGGDGGYLVPPQFTQGIMELVMPPDSFIRALNPVVTNSNLITVPADEDPYWSSSGVTATKTAEGSAITASKPAVKKINIVMHNVKSMVPVSNESLRDIPFLSSYVQRKMAQKIRWKVENYVVNGTGMDEPLGILNAPGLLSVSSDISSSTTVLGAEDLFVLAASGIGSGSFWITHPLVRAQLWSLKSDATAGYPLYVMDARQSPTGALLGEPLFVSEAAKPYNTAGDIIRASPEGYVLAFEAGGVQQAVSLEFGFDQDLTCFRATLRMGGAPTLAGTVLRADATNYTSNLCVLAARS